MGERDAAHAPVTIAADRHALAVAGRLLHDFNTEFDDPTPGAGALAGRLRELVEAGGTEVLIVGDAEGVAVLRFRPSVWSTADECYLAELYVAPEQRGRGLGRALMVAAIDAARTRGADYMDLGTSEDDVAARALYESLGFINREGAGGPITYFDEREL